MRALALALAAIATSSCGAALMKLPAGPGTAAPDATGALAQAVGACRGLRTLTAEIGVSGSANGHRLSGRLNAGVAAPASARLEAMAPFGQPLFIFVATGDDATLLLPRDNRLLEHGHPDEVLAAITGVPLGASDLREMITGCTSDAAPDSPQSRAFGADWRVVPTRRDGGEVYLHRVETNGWSWRLVAMTARTGKGRVWRADYSDFQNDVARTIRLTSAGPPAFDLRLALSQVEMNVALNADVFRVQMPKGVDPITLEELRRSGPLGVDSPPRPPR
jgi:hypothetical protein